jgi:hypothetical protein
VASISAAVCTIHVRHLLRRPLLHFLADLLHAIGAFGDELLVFPAVFEDMPNDAPDQCDVGTRAHAHKMMRKTRGAGKPRINHDDLRAQFLRMKDMKHGDRMRLRRVGADEQYRLAVMQVVEGIGHRAKAVGLRDAGDRGGVADARLVIAIVRAPHRHEFTQQIGLLITMLAGPDPESRVRPCLLPDLQQLVAHLVDRLFPGDALVFAVDQLHRIAQAPLAMTMLAYRCALGAMGAHVDRRVERSLLAHPHTVLHHRFD